MNAYWIDSSAFCPLEHGLLSKEGSISLDVYRCPNCGNRFVRVAGSPLIGDLSMISDGFIRPKEVHCCTKSVPKEPGMVLNMLFPFFEN